MKQAVPDIYDESFSSPTVAIVDRPGTVWLDSSLTLHDKGYRSLLAENPRGEFLFRNGRAFWIQDLIRRELSGDAWDEFAKLRKQFGGWWIGCVSYEATLPFLELRSNRTHPFLPDLHFYHYDSVVEFSSEPGLPHRKPFHLSAKTAAAKHQAIVSALAKEEYLARIERLLWHIHEGDIYQANFTSGFTVKSNLKPLSAYHRLRALNPAPYSAFLNFGEYQVLSSSPERMITRRGDSLITTPIKGTIARGNEHEEERNRQQLMKSAKDRAELMMIVDLERNDLGRVAAIGSVEADHSPRAEMYSSLIHLVNDVRATCREEMTADDILRAMLPGGSITGAPKRRAVEILLELETIPRGLYTGCIGYFHGDDLEFNIAIRTMIHRNGEYHIHAGSGIVADSSPAAEYEEMLLKARNLFRALDTTEEGI